MIDEARGLKNALGQSVPLSALLDCMSVLEFSVICGRKDIKVSEQRAEAVFDNLERRCRNLRAAIFRNQEIGFQVGTADD
jgi:hypothetical protein